MSVNKDEMRKLAWGAMKQLNAQTPDETIRAIYDVFLYFLNLYEIKLIQGVGSSSGGWNSFYQDHQLFDESAKSS